MEICGPFARSGLLCWLVAILLAGCAASAPWPEPAKPALQFVDLQQFDRDLGASLSAPLPRVEVSMSAPIALTALPSRLQRWLGAADEGGGEVRFMTAAGRYRPANLMDISLFTGEWSRQTLAHELAADPRLRAVQNYNVQIFLGQGRLVERIVFEQRIR